MALSVKQPNLISFLETHTVTAVSYTHLDVYKRQISALILCKFSEIHTDISQFHYELSLNKLLSQ